jgi:CysZ protein
MTQFAAGVGLLGKGFATYVRSPGLLLLGMVPALLAFVVLASGFIAVLVFLGPEARAVTWFANSWSSTPRDLIRVVAAIALVGLSGLIAVVVFTALTLAIGDPFYEKISERVEERFGGLVGTVPLSWWRELLRSIGESIRLIGVSAGIGGLLFIAGFLPAVGQTVIPVLGALVGGWALALELTGVAFARRGLRLRERRKVLRQHRFLALGFGVAVFACFLIPLGAVLVMPAAVAGGTLLTRRVYGLPS